MAKNGTWEGVENAPLIPGQSSPPRFAAGSGRFFSLVDASGHVVLAGSGDQVGDLLPQSVIQNGNPIKVNGKIVGTMVTRQPTIRVNPAETAFLDRVKQIYHA